MKEDNQKSVKIPIYIRLAAIIFIATGAFSQFYSFYHFNLKPGFVSNLAFNIFFVFLGIDLLRPRDWRIISEQYDARVINALNPGTKAAAVYLILAGSLDLLSWVFVLIEKVNNFEIGFLYYSFGYYFRENLLNLIFIFSGVFILRKTGWARVTAMLAIIYHFKYAVFSFAYVMGNKDTGAMHFFGSFLILGIWNGIWFYLIYMENLKDDEVAYEEVMTTHNTSDLALVRSILDSSGLDYHVHTMPDPAQFMMESQIIVVAQTQANHARKILKDVRLTSAAPI